MLSEEDAAGVNTVEDYDAKVGAGKLKSVRIRRVTGGGSYSSSTKAKYTFSIPIKVRYVSELRDVSGKVEKRLEGFPLVWKDVVIPGNTKQPVFTDIAISSATLYHPSPIRIENVQHDAVLSLNDPSDKVNAVILIPLKGSNTGSESETFFSKIAKHVISISTPDSVSGMYQRVDIPTGSDWNIKQVFWLSKTNEDGYAKVNDSFYTWTGMRGYKRVQLSSSGIPGASFGNISVPAITTEIRFGWEPTGDPVRYFMLGSPVNISLSDLSLITRNLPPTVPGEAMHKVPTEEPLLYKRAEGDAAAANCGIVRERMENPDDPDMCDPFAMNAKSSDKFGFNPTQIIAVIFNVLLLLGVAIGVWVAMYMITIDYDVNYKNFAQDTGKVIGTLAKQTSAKVAAVKNAAVSGVKNVFNPVSRLPALKSLADGKKSALLSAVAPTTTSSTSAQ